MLIALIVIIYVLIAGLFYINFPWTNHPNWERIMLSLSWPCSLIL